MGDISTKARDYIVNHFSELDLPLPKKHIPLFFLLPKNGELLHFKSIQEEWGISKSSLSDILSRYYGEGYILKEDSLDKRCVEIGLTPKGHDIQAQLLALEEEFVQRMLEGFDPEERELMEQQINRMLSNIKDIT